MGRKVAIVAKAGTAALAPFDDEDWEIWGIPWIFYPRVDYLFEVHTQEFCDSCEADARDDAWLPEALRRYPDIPVYCDPSRLSVFPRAIEYPLERVLAALPIPYLENTIAYQLALAIADEVEEIGLWGVHMMGRGEFMWQRPSVTYLVGLAQGKGIKVTNVPGSPLFMSGYEGGRYGLKTGERFLTLAGQ